MYVEIRFDIVMIGGLLIMRNCFVGRGLFFVKSILGWFVVCYWLFIWFGSMVLELEVFGVCLMFVFLLF